MLISPSAETIFRDFVVDGVPLSGPQEPKKSEVRAWGRSVESIVEAVATAAAVFDTRASLFADLAYAANTLAWVVADGTAAYNGIYRKSGGSGTGSWVRVADLPYSFVKMSDTGAGTANAIQVASSIPTSDSVLRISNVFEANTGNVTISENGGAAKALLTNSGNQVPPGGLVAGMMIVYTDNGSNFRLLSDQTSAAIQAAAEAAQAAAENARDSAAGYAALALNNWVVDLFVGDGTSDPLTLTANPGSLNNCIVIIEGLGVQPVGAFALVGNELTPSEPWPNGVGIEVRYGTSIEVGTPSDGSVTENKIGSNAVTRAKIAAEAVGPDELDDETVNSDHIDATAAAAIVAKLGLTRLAFRAHKDGTNQTGITSGAATKLTFGTESFDMGGYYDASTSRFNPPAGKYRLSVSALTAGGAVDQSVFGVMIYKNGNLHSVAYNSWSGTSNISAVCTDIVDANGTDYFEAYFEGFGTGSKSINGAATSTWFSGEAV
ncbi:hypothetical protein [Nostoc phage Nsp-JY10]